MTIKQKIINTLSGENILDQNEKVHKIGIQAPQGTRFSLEGHNFIMGKTGIFEVEDNNITFTSLTFPEQLITDQIIVDYISE